MTFPVFDLHCDLLSYLIKYPKADPFNTEKIACAVPFLQQGNVKVQVCAIYTDVRSESMQLGLGQAELFSDLVRKYPETFYSYQPDSDLKEPKIGIFAAIENAAGIGNEEAKWSEIYRQFDLILEKVGQLAYISLTHHTENRFGGGNYTEGIGLKDDGKKLLEYMSGKKIPIDLSHTSDLLAEGIFNHISSQNLKIPVIASHSNYRAIWNHKRNLSDEFAQEIVRQEGIIGVNFLRAFLDNDVPERLFEHILHGFEIGGEKAQCFGADFFFTKDFPDKNRHPFYFPLTENASKYPSILEELNKNLTEYQLQNLASENAFHFYHKLHR
ncbi:dipeptidase [Algoriphagus hitonicola]|uniref:Zn-dependent dipeptidase, dipeptidase homolog n=1 Tax=Algoriphagus hitonicola TaxID=435880 RepID=A0A1I2SFL4_9BACT|nr:membrane dipeptidase [Algoriphagus hitonicola]SFG51548.1 Zn-dependent dipeptidase, dipeptidase homolog [Algoriphagus hitonicola]